MKTKPVLFAYCLLMTAMMLPGCSGCWKKTELQVVNPTRYLEVQDDQQAEIWELIRIKGEVAGYRHTMVTRSTEDGETIYKMTQEDVISANRLGEPMTGRIEMIVQQKRDGTFLLGDKTESLSGQSMVTMFRPDESSSTMLRRAGTWAFNPETGDEEANADPRDKTLPWKPGTLGPFGKQFSLWEKPLAPGEQRTIEYFDLMFEQIVTVEMAAGKIESLLYNNRETHLLPVVETTRIGSYVIISQFWMDANGNIVRTTLNTPIPMEIALSTQERAMSAKENAGRVNLKLLALVRVRGTIPQPRMSQQIAFRLHRINPEGQSGSQPAFADLFPTTAFQTVNVVDENTLDVTVTASSPTALMALTGSVLPSAAKEPPVPADLQRNEWIQSDSEQIAKLAAEATESTSRSWEVAAELECYVSQKLQRVSYQQAFASAAEVAETLQGDSAGYAVLLAAMARVQGIPARVVAGLVYTNTNTNEGVMVPHFWTEMSIDGHWHSFDATTGQGGADASRIVLARSNLTDESLPALVAKTLPLLGHLQVTIKGTGN
jgi:hypothetical protein